MNLLKFIQVNTTSCIDCDYCERDPFVILHSDVHEQILKYLSGEDLINASLVNTTWHDIINASDSLKKIRLNLDFSPNRVPMSELDEVLQTIRKSERTYTNMAINYTANSKFELLKLLCGSSQKLRSLKIGEVFGLYEYLPRIYSWDNLKELSIGFVSSDVLDLFAYSKLDLHTLIFNNQFQITKHTCVVAKFIASQSNLKTLHLLGDTNSHILLIVLTLKKLLQDENPPFQLKDLAFGKTGSYNLEPVHTVVEGLCWFFNSQKKSLKLLTMLCVPNHEVLNYIYANLKVQKLVLHPASCYINDYAEPLSLVDNSFITELRLSKTFYVEHNMDLVQHATNLKIFASSEIPVQMIPVFSDIAMKLKLVEYNYLDMDCLRSYFHFCSLQSAEINKSIEFRYSPDFIPLHGYYDDTI